MSSASSKDPAKKGLYLGFSAPPNDDFSEFGKKSQVFRIISLTIARRPSTLPL
jgi:hypothetical protein